MCVLFGFLTSPSVCFSPVEALVHAVEPYTKQELEVLCLPDVIQLYSFQFQGNICRNPLVYLYPDIPKDSAFGPYYKISGSLSCLPLRTISSTDLSNSKLNEEYC